MEFTYNGLVRYSFGFYNPNHAAALFAMLLPFGIMLWFCSKKPGWRILSLALAALLVTGIVFTYSRAGLFSAASAMLIFTILHGKYEKIKLHRRHILILAGCAVTLFGVIVLSGGAERFFSWIYAPDRSVTNRFDLWGNSLLILRDNPFGVGPGMSGRIYTLFYQEYSKTTAYRTLVNSFLTFLAEYGIIAGAALLTAMLFGMLQTVRLIHQEASGIKRLALIALISSFAGAVINGMLSTCFDINIALEQTSGDTNVFMQRLLLSFFLIELCFMTACVFDNIRTCICQLALCGGVAVALLTGLLLCGTMLERKRNIYCRVNDESITIRRTLAKSDVAYVVHENIHQDQIIPILPNVLPDKNIHLYYRDSEARRSNFPLVLCGNDCIDNISAGHIILFPLLPPQEVAPNGMRLIILDKYDEAGVNFLWRRFAAENLIPVRLVSRAR